MDFDLLCEGIKF